MPVEVGFCEVCFALVCETPDECEAEAQRLRRIEDAEDDSPEVL